MNAVKRTAVDVLILGVVGSAAAITVNGVRAAGLSLFERHIRAEDEIRDQIIRIRDDKDGGGRPRVRPPSPPTDENAESLFQVLSLDEVETFFRDPGATSGATVFIDARDDDHFEEGHVPGAVQANHYRLEDYIDNVLDHTDGAERVIVYCNGGDCEDSLFLCSDLLGFDVPYEKLFIFTGGWKEWAAKGMPVAKGRERA